MGAFTLVVSDCSAVDTHTGLVFGLSMLNMSYTEIASSSLQAPVKQTPVQPTLREGGITKLKK